MQLYLMDLLTKKKKIIIIISKLNDTVDYKFEYVGLTKDVSFYEYMNSKELFNAIKNTQIKSSDAKNKRNVFLNKLNNIKIGKKISNKKKRLITLKKFTILEKKLLSFLETILKCYLMLITIQNKMKPKEKDLKY